jgi:hypothetical protein
VKFVTHVLVEDTDKKMHANNSIPNRISVRLRFSLAREGLGRRPLADEPLPPANMSALECPVQDEAEARRLLGLAAAQGHAKSQCVLAVLHADGRDGPKDEAEARTVDASERRQ